MFSKTVKLWGHFFRYPADVLFIPIYISFGYFHGLIKLWGLFTLSEVCFLNLPTTSIDILMCLEQTTWGSRDGADADDRVRMIRLPRYGSMSTDGRKSETFEYPHEVMQQLPAYDTKYNNRLDRTPPHHHHETQHLISCYD